MHDSAFKNVKTKRIFNVLAKQNKKHFNETALKTVESAFQDSGLQ